MTRLTSLSDRTSAGRGHVALASQLRYQQNEMRLCVWRTKYAETITIEDAQNHLAELIAALIPGEEIVIIQNDQPVAGLRELITTPSRASAIAKAN
jgi:hypothetical protein